MAFIKPIEYLSKFVRASAYGTKSIQLDFELISPKTLAFKAGQFINLKVAEGVYRSYSLCSDCSDENHVSIVASIGHEGVGSNYLKALKPGDEVSFIGASGNFLLRQNLADELVFFATGTGVAPFMSMLYYLAATKHSGKVRLHFGVRQEADILFKNVLEYFKKTMVDFDYTLYISKPESTDKTTPQRVTRALDGTLNPNAQYYLCGHPDMVETISTGLLHKGIPAQNIIFEKFTRSVA